MKVTIIIGAYNVANFLKSKRLSCILNQTYKNLEIILVNDGSTDSTATLCDELKRQDSRIHVIHKENGGLGSARNAGLDYATGDYIWFYDVDDEASLELIERNVEIVSKHNVDFCVFGFDVITEATDEREIIAFNEQLLVSNEELKSVYMDVFVHSRHGNGFNWNKFYNRDFLNKYNIRFGNQRIQQDEVFNIQLYPYLERVYIMPDILYEYYLVVSGNTRSRYLEERLEIFLDIHQKLTTFTKEWLNAREDYIKLINFRLYCGLVNVFEFNLNHSDCPLTKKQKLNYMSSALRNKVINRIVSDRNISSNISGVYYKIVNFFIVKEKFKLLQLVFTVKKIIIRFRKAY
nr:glycosyltransferase family 2 protein [uncultured Vibrio sp.]